MHNNMITVNGQKMGKSLGNFITLEEFFTGNHPKLDQAYEPMTIRFFILQAHYRSTLDFSNEALQSAEKGLQRLLQVKPALERIRPSAQSQVSETLREIGEKCYQAMDDDFNTPVLISHLFELAKLINAGTDNKAGFSSEDISTARKLYGDFVQEILGLDFPVSDDKMADRISAVMDVVLEIRAQAKANKDWATSDLIRDRLKKTGITVMDGKEGATWKLD